MSSESTSDSVAPRSTSRRSDAPMPENCGIEQVAILRHRRGTRWMHWINFPLLAIMIWSGLRIYAADSRDPFGFGIGLVGWHWFDFLPDSVNDALGLRRKLAKGLAWHFTFGWLFTLNGLAYAIYSWRTREWRHVFPERRSFGDAAAVIRHDLFIRNKPLPPQGRYNGAQRLSYTLILVLGAVAIVTGFAIYRPSQLNLLTRMLGGYERAKTIHFFVTISFLVFFVVHVLQVVRAGWKNFASMVTGYEVIDRPVPGGLVAEPDLDPDGPVPPGDAVPPPDAVRDGFVGLNAAAAGAAGDDLEVGDV